MNQVSGCYTEVEFDSLSFLVHGSVRDFLRYLAPPSGKLSLLLDKVYTQKVEFDRPGERSPE